MYQALDEFLRAETWTSFHPIDMERFYGGLNAIIRRADFSTEDMGEYIDQKYVEWFGRPSDGTDRVVDRLVQIAYYVQRYMEVAGLRDRQD